MPELPDSQKKISQEYSGHLAYFRRPHYLRRLKLLCFTGAVVATVLGIVTYEKWASPKAFSTGPLSQNHAHLADRCESCHSGSDKGLGLGFVVENLGKLSSLSSLEAMDAACITCHPGTQLHAPQMQLIGLRNPAKGSLVHASACSTCHREHAGPQRMALPSDRSCTYCHGDVQKLEASLSAPLKAAPQSQTPGVKANSKAIDLGEGVLLFLPPTQLEALPAFESFAQGHPNFGYERADAVDPSNLKFNHARHFRSDIPQSSNGKLDCASCHQPEPNGVFYQPVRYEKHCQECHSLQILQSLPNLRIPHGDSEKVRLFLAGLQSSVEANIKASGVTEALAVSVRVKEEMESLRRRGLYSMDDLQKRVFLQGDPQDTTESERLMRSGRPKFLTECAKCHSVKDGDTGMGPEVDTPVVASRWLGKGQFNHLPHKQSACKDCHGAAEKSKLTSDILLPTQQSCVECHQPPNGDKGGVKFSCQSCHHFHSSVAPEISEAAAKATPKPTVSSIPFK